MAVVGQVGGRKDVPTHLLLRLLLVPRWLCWTLPCSCSNPGVLTEVGGGLGVDSLFILLLDIKHLFLTRPVASIGNMFPLPNMQILALFAQFCECFLNLDDCITREDHDHSFTLLKLCLRTYNLINTENPQ